jgi:hypothetical protein
VLRELRIRQSAVWLLLGFVVRLIDSVLLLTGSVTNLLRSLFLLMSFVIEE